MLLNTKFLNGTRFFLALWVGMIHFNSMIAFKLPFPLPDVSSAVDGFMVVTGFLMMYHYALRQEKEPYNLKSTIINFWIRRFFRLYPIYILVIIIAFLTYYPVIEYREFSLSFFSGITYEKWADGISITRSEPNIFTLFSHLTFIHGFIPSHVLAILGPAWSLSLEMQFYLLFPFIYIFIFNKEKFIGKKILLFTILSSVLSICMMKVFGYHEKLGFFDTFSFREPSILLYKMPLFLFGMIMALACLKKIKKIEIILAFLFIMPIQNLTTNLLLTFIFTMMFLDYFKAIINKKVYSILEMIRKFLSFEVFALGADLSYSFYLTHTLIMPPIIKFSITIFQGISNNIYFVITVAFIMSLLVNFSICYLLFRFVEKPFIKIGKRQLVETSNSIQIEKRVPFQSS